MAGHDIVLCVSSFCSLAVLFLGFEGIERFSILREGACASLTERGKGSSSPVQRVSHVGIYPRTRGRDWDQQTRTGGRQQRGRMNTLADRGHGRFGREKMEAALRVLRTARPAPGVGPPGQSDSDVQWNKRTGCTWAGPFVSPPVSRPLIPCLSPFRLRLVSTCVAAPGHHRSRIAPVSGTVGAKERDRFQGGKFDR